VSEDFVVYWIHLAGAAYSCPSFFGGASWLWQGGAVVGTALKFRRLSYGRQMAARGTLWRSNV
jgi:hypothetical protein